MNDSEPCNSDEVGVSTTGIDRSTAATVDQSS
jgi:hypothetical protein